MSYTLHLGDCLDVMRTLEPNSIGAVVTDPPYGISYQSNWCADGPRFDVIHGDDELPTEWAAEAARVAPAVFAFCEWRHAERLRAALEAAGLGLRGQVVWDRGAHGMGDLQGGVAPMHDLAWVAARPGWVWPGARMKSVLRHTRPTGTSLQHPCQKPHALMAEVVAHMCPRGGVVLDPFMGSGSTGVAALAEGRRFVGIEREPAYYEIARKRIAEGLSGARAVNAETQLALFGGPA